MASSFGSSWRSSRRSRSLPRFRARSPSSPAGGCSTPASRRRCIRKRPGSSATCRPSSGELARSADLVGARGDGRSADRGQGAAARPAPVAATSLARQCLRRVSRCSTCADAPSPRRTRRGSAGPGALPGSTSTRARRPTCGGPGRWRSRGSAACSSSPRVSSSSSGRGVPVAVATVPWESVATVVTTEELLGLPQSRERYFVLFDGQFEPLVVSPAAGARPPAREARRSRRVLDRARSDRRCRHLSRRVHGGLGGPCLTGGCLADPGLAYRRPGLRSRRRLRLERRRLGVARPAVCRARRLDARAVDGTAADDPGRRHAQSRGGRPGAGGADRAIAGDGRPRPIVQRDDPRAPP